MAVLNLTEARIRELPFGSGIHRDEQVKGLMVICHASTRTYAVQGDVRRNGRHVRTVRLKIDRCDRIGLREARNKAKAIMSQIQSGVDPTAGPAETGITLKQALDAHLSEKTYSPRTAEGYRYHLENYLTKFRSRAVADITRQDVRELFDTLIREMCTRWRVSPIGTADDAIFARARGHNAATIADEFSRAGVMFSPAGKGSRKAGWQRMRTLLSQSGSPDRPGLYLSRRCDYAWETLPVLPRDPRDIEDVDSAAPDHAADALRYGVIWKRPEVRQGTW